MAEGKTDLLRRAVFGRLSQADEEEHLDFLISSHKGEFDRAIFESRADVKRLLKWKYTDVPAPAPSKPLIWICRLDGRIVGQICVMPAEIKISGKIYAGGWLQDFIIAPEFRSIGIGGALVRHMLKPSENAPDILMAAGTNERSYALFRKCGFADIGFIGRNIYPTDFWRIFNRLIPNDALRSLAKAVATPLFRLACLRAIAKSGRGIEVSEVPEFDDRFDRLSDELSGKYACIVSRSAGTLRWRYSDRPGAHYVILAAKAKDGLKGYAVLREGGFSNVKLSGLRAGIISDVLFNPEEPAAGAALIKAAIGRFGKGVDIVRCDLLDTVAEKVVRGCGFLGAGSRNRFLVRMSGEGIVTGHKATPLSAANWHLTYGDSDLDLY